MYKQCFWPESSLMFNDTKKQRSEWKQKQLSQHELEERQSWIDHDNELAEMNEYYDRLNDDPWINDYTLEDEILEQ